MRGARISSCAIARLSGPSSSGHSGLRITDCGVGWAACIHNRLSSMISIPAPAPTSAGASRFSGPSSTAANLLEWTIWTSAFILDFRKCYFPGLICFDQGHQLAVFLQFDGAKEALHHVARDEKSTTLPFRVMPRTPNSSVSLTALDTEAANSVVVISAFFTEKMLNPQAPKINPEALALEGCRGCLG
jgi:hypothetical protein